MIKIGDVTEEDVSMSSTEQTFDQASQDRLIDTFAASDYTERYFRLCNNFQEDGDLDSPRLDLARTVDIFRDTGIKVYLDKRFKVFTFDRQEAAGWTWQGKLIVQKYDNLEPMFEGDTSCHAIGSTMLDLADAAGDRRSPPLPRQRLLPPYLNRPRFDGDMRTMTRLVAELVALNRWMRELIVKNWTA